MTRFLLTLGLVGLLWGVLYLHDSGPREPLDQFILGGIGLVFGLAALVMLLGRSEWSARAMGLFLTSVAASVFYCSLTVASVWGHRINEGLIDLVRVCYTVGGLLLLYGLVTWVWVHWRVVKPTGFVPGERRLTVRRAEDRQMRADLLAYKAKLGERWDEDTADRAGNGA